MSETRRVIIPYSPRSQFLPYHRRSQRWAAIVAHRRAGKTVATINDIIKRALTCPLEAPRYAYIAPYYVQAKDIAWVYLKRFAAPVIEAAGGSTNESELRVELPNGATIRLYGAENGDRLRGIYLDGVVLDEFADFPPSLWNEVLRPALSDRKGWATFVGTPKGKNAFYDLCKRAQSDPEWYALTLKASETGILDAEELAAARRDMTAEQYAQEYEGSFDAAITGAYYSRELAEAEAEGRITTVPYERRSEVVTAWDLGVSDQTAIWFAQVVGREIRIIDYYESSGVGLDHYVAILKSKPYQYGTHILPHDAEVRELGTGKSRVETLKSLGLRDIRVGKALSVADGINAVRMTLPQCWIDSTRCDKGIEALRQYRTEWDDKRRIFLPRPRHDWTSHACLVAGQTVLTSRGQVPIESVRIGDDVITPAGLGRVTHSGPVKMSERLIEIETTDGKKLVCTPEHKLLTDNGFKCADELRYNSRIFSGGEWQCLAISWISTVIGSGFRASITNDQGATRTRQGFFTALCGSFTMARYLMGSASITRTTTQPTTTYQTLSACQSQSITGTMSVSCGKSSVPIQMLTLSTKQTLSRGKDLLKAGVSCLKETLRCVLKASTTEMTCQLSTQGATSGLSLMSVLSSTGNWQSADTPKGLFSHQVETRLSWQHSGTSQSRAASGTLSTPRNYGKVESGMRRFARNVASRIALLFLAAPSSATRIAKLKHLEGAEGSQLVFDLTVQNHGCYQANGILVSNSDAMRYLCVDLRENHKTKVAPPSYEVAWEFADAAMGY